MRTPLLRRALPLALGLVLGACAGTPAGPAPGTALAAGQIDAEGQATSERITTRIQPMRDHPKNRFIRCVADALIEALPDDPGRWQVIVLDDPSANALALPDSWLIVSSGMLDATRGQKGLFGGLKHALFDKEGGGLGAIYDQEQLAAALAHALAHLASAQIAQQAAGVALSAEMAALLATRSNGYSVSYSRDQEAAADHVATALMAKAGFHPRGMVELWQNLDTIASMATTGGVSAPEYLGVHPLDRARLKSLEAEQTTALPDYDAAVGRGLRPACS